VTSVSVQDPDWSLNQVGSESNLDPDWDPDPDPGRPKLSPKKEKLKSIMCKELSVLSVELEASSGN
jgi:hypothetical protein